MYVCNSKCYLPHVEDIGFRSLFENTDVGPIYVTNTFFGLLLFERRKNSKAIF